MRSVVAVLTVAVGLGSVFAACGTNDSSSRADSEASDAGVETADESRPVYRVRLVASEFPAAQTVGETGLLRLGFENAGEEFIPELSVEFEVDGREAPLFPFAIYEQTPGLTKGDQPVWVLADGYPRIEGTGRFTGPPTASLRVFRLGNLHPGQTKKAVWKLRAAKPGRFQLRYIVHGDLTPTSEIQSGLPGPAGRSFPVEIDGE